MQAEPFQRDQEFDTFLDEEGAVLISGIELLRSDILATCAPQQYEARLAEYKQQRRERVRESIIDDYPHPIAFAVDLFENELSNQLSRLHLLRDVWENSIKFLFAVLVAEITYKKIGAARLGLTQARILTDRLGDRLMALNALATTEDERLFDLACHRLMTPGVVGRLGQLHRDHRHALAHDAALSEAQARAEIESIEPTLLDVLIDLEPIKDIHLFRFIGTAESAFTIYHEAFIGSILNRRRRIMTLSKKEFDSCAAYLDRDHILAQWNNQILNLSPLVHFREDDDGHFTRVALFKRCRDSDAGREFRFGILGGPREVAMPAAFFNEDMARAVRAGSDLGT